MSIKQLIELTPQVNDKTVQLLGINRSNLGVSYSIRPSAVFGTDQLFHMYSYSDQWRNMVKGNMDKFEKEGVKVSEHMDTMTYRIVVDKNTNFTFLNKIRNMAKLYQVDSDSIFIKLFMVEFEELSLSKLRRYLSA